MVVFTVMVMNKAGSLLFVQDYAEIPKLPANERIMLASTFHGLSAIAGQLSPGTDNSGIQILESDTFKLQSFMSLTGMNFLVMASLDQTGVEQLLKKIYLLYADYVLKNPFYSLDMPIRCALFDKKLSNLVKVSETSAVWRQVEARDE
eukprot:m.447414 g.447414  ORF g.447414 m.447414 type:complete len:148 (+) comp19512_c0_seq1:179-622(+)